MAKANRRLSLLEPAVDYLEQRWYKENNRNTLAEAPFVDIDSVRPEGKLPLHLGQPRNTPRQQNNQGSRRKRPTAKSKNTLKPSSIDFLTNGRNTWPRLHHWTAKYSTVTYPAKPF